MMRDEDIERVKSMVNMVQLAEAYGFNVNRTGYTLCPFHNDKHPSMQVFRGYLTEDGYYCRSCGAGGTIFNFVMKYENITFEEAVRRIADMFSIPISEADEKPSSEEREQFRRRILLREVDQKIEETNRIGMIQVSEKIRLYEHLMQSARPLGSLFCYLANKLPVLQAEWEWRFEVLCRSKKYSGAG